MRIRIWKGVADLSWYGKSPLYMFALAFGGALIGAAVGAPFGHVKEGGAVGWCSGFIAWVVLVIAAFVKLQRKSYRGRAR